ncbi:nucleotide cyclase, HAMP and GGDEF-related domain-containing [Syntrophotalea carbinolica DSM 2380]|uniref:diguanylate cyclase n=1 Tax=Syntrophotalea carbinolica (strain DSM 2380 / NBRC 103641 / GraBd1) TaxID=338963 RepID=Q3A277_SYNC1|nr:diguanylate cyclase [Syntrophotalea carbinolica]ABA89530.1 nucleotide cyclase, HAMP and GGDEF-related domain-containing [Syntrophotalea carbinolica DSM 2380]
MPLIRFSVAQKIAAGYLLVVVFCLAAIVYALTALNSLTQRSESLVVHEFRAVVLARDFARSLLDDERLEKQTLILRDAAMLPLLDARQEELDSIFRRLAAIPLQGRFDEVEHVYTALTGPRVEERALLEEHAWDKAEQLSSKIISPLREQLFQKLQQFRLRQEDLMDQTLHTFSEKSSNAFRLTLALAFAGIGLAASVAAAIIVKFHRSIARLTEATRAVASGSFNHPVGLNDEDEFGRLALDFAEMEKKLNELQTFNLDANPLTRLPGNLTIERELEGRIASGRPFAHIYVDLDYFKAYNDRYGYHAGSDIIAKVGIMVKAVAARLGNDQDLIGHVGGDDYVILSTPDRAEPLAAEMIKQFDMMVPGFYTEEDRKVGYFKGQDRYGVEREFPLLSMSVAIVCSDNLRNPSAEAIGRECAKMKEYLKKLPGSNYLIDRREKR